MLMVAVFIIAPKLKTTQMPPPSAGEQINKPWINSELSIDMAM